MIEYDQPFSSNWSRTEQIDVISHAHKILRNEIIVEIKLVLIGRLGMDSIGSAYVIIKRNFE